MTLFPINIAVPANSMPIWLSQETCSVSIHLANDQCYVVGAAADNWA